MEVNILHQGKSQDGDMTMPSGVVSMQPSLTREGLSSLLSGEAIALRIPEYYPAQLSFDLGQGLLQHPRFGYYVNAENIGRVGMAYFEATESQALREQYYLEALNAIRDVRDFFHPYLSPIDRLRLELSEIWPKGASFENIEGSPMFVGLARVFTDGAEALPHQDILGRDAPQSPLAHTLEHQLAANIYLKTAPSGGELEIWDEVLNDHEYENLRLPGSYGLDRRQLPAPAVCIAPRGGDLIIFNSRRVHAVRPASGGPRITLSCFLGFRGHHEAITFWS